jgi:hypothetical protein
MGLEYGGQKAIVRRIGQGSLVDQRIVRQWTYGPKPGMAERRTGFWIERVCEIYRTKVQRPVLCEDGPGLGRNLISHGPNPFQLRGQGLRLRCLRRRELMVHSRSPLVERG